MIVKDEKTGKSTNFSTTKEGFREAYHQIKSIEASGHTASGEAARVRDYARKMGWQ